MRCGIGHRRGSHPALLWLWWRPAATALIRPLAWEPPYATRMAHEMAKRQKKGKKRKGKKPQALLAKYRLGNYIQSLGINYEEENMAKECTYKYIWIALHRRSWHNTVNQLCFNVKQTIKTSKTARDLCSLT